MRSIPRLTYLSVLFVLLLFQCTTTTYPSNYYVDKNASGQNNGTSWADAWQSFTDINWGSMQPGDVVYISGGTDSTTYNSTLNIGASGSKGNYITIRNSYDTGHNGRVIIRPSGSGISPVGRHDIYIKGLEIWDAGSRGIYMYGGCYRMVFDSLIIKNCTEQGIWWENSDTVEVKHCVVLSKLLSAPADDNIYMQNTHYVIIHHNRLHMRNLQTYGNHIDNIQSANAATDMYIYNNFCITDSAVQGHNIIIGQYSENADYRDTVLVYNNFMYDGGNISCNYQRSMYFRSSEGGQPYIPIGYCINNTIVTANWGAPALACEGYPVWCSNNIVTQMGVNGTTPGSCENGNWTWSTAYSSDPRYYIYVDSCHTNLLWRAYGTNNPAFANNEFVGAGGSSIGTPSDWSDYVNNYGGDGVNKNPEFTGNWRLGQYQIGSGSPAIDAGTNMSYILNKFATYLPEFNVNSDIEGNPRNDGHWDIGAYEYVEEHGNLDIQNNSYNLSQNYPNPFNPTTAIEYYTPQLSRVKLVVYNMIGQEVQTLVDGEKASGLYEVKFNAANLPSGIYFYRLLAANIVETKKMVLLR